MGIQLYVMAIHKRMCVPMNTIVCVVLLVLLKPNNCYGGFEVGVRANTSSNKALFIFGDSLFDAGNSQYFLPNEFIHANHHPYGMSYVLPTGRNSDGLLLPDFIAQYAGLPLIPPFLDPTANGTNGFNFASAGAGVLYHADAMNLDLQLLLFENVTRKYNETIGAEETSQKLRNAVYIFAICGADYLSFSLNSPNATDAEKEAYVDLVVTKLLNGFKEIYEKGGRKFAIQDVGPLGCFPSTKYELGIIEGCDEKMSELAVMHNAALRNALKIMKESDDYSDIKYAVLDFYNQLRNRILNPRHYGFTVGEIACCGIGGFVNGASCGDSPYFLCTNPSSFVFFDPYHPSQAVNTQTSTLMWSGDQNFVGPYNVQQLFEDDEEELEKAS